MKSSRNIGLTGLIARNARCCQVMRLLVISSTHQLDELDECSDFFLLHFFNAQRCASIGIDGSGFQCKSSMNFAKFLASNTQCCQVMRSLINSMNWWLLSFDNEKRQTMWPFFFIQENIRWKSEYFANLISWNPLLPYCCQEFPKKKKLKKKKKNRHYHPIIRLG